MVRDTPDASEITVVALDDNERFLEDGLLILRQEGFDLHCFTEPDEFIEFCRGFDGVVVALVDHDLGRESTGYDAVKRLRETRSDGLVLPIVYLTGRETEAGFLAAEAADPYAAPSLYVSKRDLATVDLDRMVFRLAEQSRSAILSADEEALSRALDALQHLPDEQLWTS